MSQQQTSILTGRITDLRQYPKRDTTKVMIDNAHLAFVKRLLEGAFLGIQINLTGSWRFSPKPTIGKYFAAQDYNVPPKRVRKKRNLPLARRLFGKKEVPKRAQATIDRLESLLWHLLENKRKALAKKIALKIRPEDALDVRDNPYTLYLKRMLDFSTAEILALKEYESGAQMDIVHPDRVKSALSEVLKDAYNEGHTFLPIAEVQEKVAHRLDDEAQITSEMIEGVKKSVAVIEEGNVYSPKIYYLRKKTISMLSNNVETVAAHDNEIVRDLLSHRYSIITGPAGSGKTTALKAVAQLEGQKIAITALTGKAASLLGDEAQTLHRLLGFGHGGFSVTQLDYDIVIVDEASMLDWMLRQRPFRVIPDHTSNIPSWNQNSFSTGPVSLAIPAVWQHGE